MTYSSFHMLTHSSSSVNMPPPSVAAVVVAVFVVAVDFDAETDFAEKEAAEVDGRDANELQPTDVDGRDADNLDATDLLEAEGMDATDFLAAGLEDAMDLLEARDENLLRSRTLDVSKSSSSESEDMMVVIVGDAWGEQNRNLYGDSTDAKDTGDNGQQPTGTSIHRGMPSSANNRVRYKSTIVSYKLQMKDRIEIQNSNFKIATMMQQRRSNNDAATTTTQRQRRKHLSLLHQNC